MPTGVYCRNKNIKYGMTGKNHSFESKKKIGESSKGRNDGEKNFFFGKKHTEESKRKISISKKGKRVVCGENHWNWKGGMNILKRQEKIAGRKKPEQCELCGAFGRICFDHNHETGDFRGWICSRCNLVLGLVKDNTELLFALIKYLKNTK